MIIFYGEYQAHKGTTEVLHFWGDIHNLSFRADKVINTHEDLKDVVERFKKDRTQFDVTDYSGRARFIKANREYESLVESIRNIEAIVFKYQGKVYRTKTTKYSVLRKIRKYADEILVHKRIQVQALISDATEEIIGVKKVLQEFDLLNIDEDDWL